MVAAVIHRVNRERCCYQVEHVARAIRLGHDVNPALLDDHLLRDVLSTGATESFLAALHGRQVQTTNMHYYRLCRSAAAAKGRQLTGGWTPDQRAALGRVLTSLPPEISIVPMKDLAWRMAELANLLSLSTLGAETVAAAEATGASVLVWAKDDGPRIRQACLDSGIGYMPVNR